MNTPATIDQLQTLIRGRLIRPGDPEYDVPHRRGGADPRPAVIVRPVDAADMGADRFAREAGLPLAVRSGGHSSAGHSTTKAAW